MPDYDFMMGGFTNDIDGGKPFWSTKEIASTITEESNPVMIEAILK